MNEERPTWISTSGANYAICSVNWQPPRCGILVGTSRCMTGTNRRYMTKGGLNLNVRYSWPYRRLSVTRHAALTTRIGIAKKFLAAWPRYNPYKAPYIALSLFNGSDPRLNRNELQKVIIQAIRSEARDLCVVSSYALMGLARVCWKVPYMLI